VRFVWTDAGDDPSWHIGDRHGVDGYFAPLFDPLSAEVLAEAGRRGHVQGVYFGHNWRPASSPLTIVREVNAEYKRLAKIAPRLRLMWNLEEHDPDFVLDLLLEWRRAQPRVQTSWSPEGMQGGWMHPEFVEGVLACRVRVVPQAFSQVGDRVVRRESDVVKADLVRRGFPEHVVSCFYLASELGLEWDGYAFRMGLLPPG
jgi:hypothetical protein